jgi:2-dehydropantoate 2-reductase
MSGDGDVVELDPGHQRCRVPYRSMKTRIGVVGAGAVGCVVGGLLAKAGHDVTLIDQWPEHVEAIRRRGLRLTGTCGEHTIPIAALHLHEAQSIREPFDALFVAVKSYDTEWATRLGSQYLKDDGVVVDFQNGINDRRVAAIAGEARTLGCVILIGAGMYEPGVAMRTDEARLGFKVGELDGRDTPRAQGLAQLLTAVAGAKVTTNLWGERWSKLAINCMLNPVAGLSGLGTAECRTEPGPRRIAVHLGSEVIRVGRGHGFEVEPIFGIAAQRFVDAAEGRGLEAVEAEMGRDARARAGGRPSMLQDVMRRRRTEIDHLNGYVVDEGRRVGVKTPFNETIVELYRAHGVRLVPDPTHLQPLLEMLP